MVRSAHRGGRPAFGAALAVIGVALVAARACDPTVADGSRLADAAGLHAYERADGLGTDGLPPF